MKKSLLVILTLLFYCGLALGQATRYVSANKLNLREQPDKNATLIQSLTKGTEVEVLEEYQDGWSRIRIDGVEGYVSSHYLMEAIDTPSNTSEDAQQEEAHASPPPTSTPSAPKAAPREVIVYVCDSRTAYAYHSSTSCRGLNRCTHGVIKVTKSEAENDYGRVPCKICY